MLDMQVIEALYLKDKGPHDYLHIKHDSATPVTRVRLCAIMRQRGCLSA